MNKWFLQQGFAETMISRFRNRPIHQFEKTIRLRDGREMTVRITRLLADTDLDEGELVTFARFLANAIKVSDVIVYEGHSGEGAELKLADIEKRAGLPIEFDRKKHQLFFFDACSSYSYFLGMFSGKKASGTLAVLTNGLASLFGAEIPVTRKLYQILMDPDQTELTWSELIEQLERPLRGNSFMLNVDLNLEDHGQLLQSTSMRW